MSESEYHAKVRQVERILNDPEVPMQPALVWSLLAEIERHAAAEAEA